MYNIERSRRTAKPEVQYDTAGNPRPTNLSKHLAAAELPDAEFEAWLEQQYAREEERLMQQLCREAVR